MGSDVRTVWVHGNSASLETSTGFLVERFGYFMRLKGDDANEAWTHYSFPMEFDHVRWLLSSVSIQLRTWGDGSVGRVDVWDGSTRLGRSDTPLTSPYGVHRRTTGEADPIRVVPIAMRSAQPVTMALGVSLLIRSSKPRDAIAIGAVGVTLTA